MQSPIIRPFIRWAGGKQNLVSEIYEHLKGLEVKTYYEPFLGAGSLFLYGDFKKSVLSDINADLINCYQQIKENPEEIYRLIKKYKTPVSPDTYYRVRQKFNLHLMDKNVEQAARFLFLNRTSFNGIYRVNKKGQYNVPFGKPMPAFPTKEILLAVSKKLKGTKLRTGTFEKMLTTVKAGDFVYLDPPYPELSKTAYFSHYSHERFGVDDQIKLAKVAEGLVDRGASVLISNADTPEIRELYQKWNIVVCETTRFITCKRERKRVNELIIRNC